MTRKTLLIIAFALFATGAICAADVPQTHALITDVTINDLDSPLVRAAKMVALSRSQMAVHSTKVIDNDSLRTMGSSHFSVAVNEPAALPPMLQTTTLGPVSPSQQPQRQIPAPNPNPVVVTSPFSLPPPPPTSSPIPYRPPQ
jgi:hypothetical protein